MSATLSLSARGRVAALSRSRTADDPELIDARRDLAEAKITAAIERVVADAPPLTIEQRDRLHRIIDGGAR